MSQAVAFIGLGNMGIAIARNILRGKIPLFVYNRTPEKALPLVKEGAQLLNSPAEAFKRATVVFTMVANDSALEEITTGKNGLLETIKPGCIHVSMSTVSPETTEKLQALHANKGAYFIASPVFGRPDVAAAAKLWVCFAGNPGAKKIVEPILKLIGQRLEDFGDDPKAANIVKLAGNFLILNVIESMGEALALAESNGIERVKLANFFAETLFPSPVYKTYGNIVAEKAFEPAGFKMTLGLKDISLVNKTAEASKVTMPIAKLLLTLIQDGLEHGREDLDWSAIILSAKD
ncbi:MAG: NAD(P)-dependent oxidoreductase [Parachlamydiaceae bacterium]|nr:NAD(P)-dependent oxidoreductase [Parachlamydiaceae bacterium]